MNTLRVLSRGFLVVVVICLSIDDTLHSWDCSLTDQFHGHVGFCFTLLFTFVLLAKTLYFCCFDNEI